MIKPIKLTHEQKRNLIDLCSKTWPELTFLFWRDVFLFAKINETEETEEIHWFEFVVRMAIDEERDEFMNFYLNVCSPDETNNT